MYIRFSRLSFGVVWEDDMFQRNINEILKDLPNVIGIADDILIAGYHAGERDHDGALRYVM